MIGLAAADIAHALGGHKAGAGWLCNCVAHDDRKPSLSISQGEEGRILLHCHAGCDPRDVIAELERLGLWGQDDYSFEPHFVSGRKLTSPSKCDGHATKMIDAAQRLWCESIDPLNSWAEDYLRSRGLRLPADPEVLMRTLRFHPRCPFPDGWGGPALLAAFTPIQTEVPNDPFLDPPPVAIHRIRGRGHGNKAMLGPVGGAAVMISPWWQVWETLNVCEGVETALALWREGADNPEDCRQPIWALGSAGALGTLPVISRVRRLVIWADNDTSGTGVRAARQCASRWVAAGKHAVIRYPREVGQDYAH